jgi:uncharacterized lipoprotein YajG
MPIVAVAAVVLSGCASTAPQNVRLDPPLQVPASQIGQGRVVQVVVTDNRLRKTLGIVGDLGGRYATVSVEDDFSNLVYQRIAAALRDKGFTVVPTPAADARNLDVEVRDLQYQSTKDGVVYKTEVKALVAGRARNGSETYDRVYEAGETRSGPLLPDAADNAKAVNAVVAMTLEDMINDEKLTAVLVR